MQYVKKSFFLHVIWIQINNPSKFAPLLIILSSSSLILILMCWPPSVYCRCGHVFCQKCNIFPTNKCWPPAAQSLHAVPLLAIVGAGMCSVRSVSRTASARLVAGLPPAAAQCATRTELPSGELYTHILPHLSIFFLHKRKGLSA